MNIKNKILGLRAELIDDHLYEVFHFGQGVISATVGVVDGAVAAPIYDYQIVSDSEIYIRSADIRWIDIRFEGDHLHVVRNGKKSVYKVTYCSPFKKAKYLP